MHSTCKLSLSSAGKTSNCLVNIVFVLGYQINVPYFVDLVKRFRGLGSVYGEPMMHSGEIGLAGFLNSLSQIYSY